MVDVEQGSSSSQIWEKHVRESRLFVLGSGFSADAGIPLLPVLSNQAFTMFSAETPGVFFRINRYLGDALTDKSSLFDLTPKDFQQLCTFLDYLELSEHGGGERFSDVGSRELMALRFYLAKTIAVATPSGESIPDVYLDFAEILRPTDWVITANWDTLLENSLVHLGRDFDYGIDKFNVPHIRKIHGSVNWRLGHPKSDPFGAHRLDWRAVEPSGGFIDPEPYYNMDLLLASEWHENSFFSEVRPHLVLPGFGKAAQVRPLARIWYRLISLLMFTKDIYIIGLSLADDDFILKCFAQDAFSAPSSRAEFADRRIYVINPQEEIEERYRFLRKQGAVRFLQEPFSSKHVSIMR